MEANNILVLAGSAGALQPIKHFISQLPSMFPYAVVVILHIPAGGETSLINSLNNLNSVNILGITDKQCIQESQVYIAPGDFHLLTETDKHFALSREQRVIGCRPSIDIFLESVSISFQSKATAVIFSGANSDGKLGAQAIVNAGGKLFVQCPNDAEFPIMPEAVIRSGVKHTVASSDSLYQNISS